MNWQTAVAVSSSARTLRNQLTAKNGRKVTPARNEGCVFSISVLCVIGLRAKNLFSTSNITTVFVWWWWQRRRTRARGAEGEVADARKIGEIKRRGRRHLIIAA